MLQKHVGDKAAMLWASKRIEKPEKPSSVHPPLGILKSQSEARDVAGPRGFEPRTPGLEGRCAIRTAPRAHSRRIEIDLNSRKY